ncbi:MAG: DUF5615 family PIN-like protein [Bryobacteraceae bacterium]|nr:DUF5615 family PIN-like protein [Bryobacteraceae bacterium]
MKYLLDENLSIIHAQTLRALGYDCQSVAEAGLGGSADSKVRDAAVAEGRVVITLDGDFANLIRFPTEGTPGVIRFRLHPSTDSAIAVALRWTLSRLEGVDITGKLVVVDGSKLRIRG